MGLKKREEVYEKIITLTKEKRHRIFQNSHDGIEHVNNNDIFDFIKTTICQNVKIFVEIF